MVTDGKKQGSRVMVRAEGSNKPDQATLRPGCVSLCNEHVTYTERQMDDQMQTK